MVDVYQDRWISAKAIDAITHVQCHSREHPKVMVMPATILRLLLSTPEGMSFESAHRQGRTYFTEEALTRIQEHSIINRWRATVPRPLLVFPLSNGSHWISIVIDAAGVTYEVLDTGRDRYRQYHPFPRDSQNHIAYKLSRTILAPDTSTKPRENTKRATVPQQTNDHICGPAQISLWSALTRNPLI